MLDLRLLRLLQSKEGEEALRSAAALAPAESDFLPASQQLARRFPDDLARAAVEQTLLRERARAKFPRASQLFFLREALEQATAEAVAVSRARRFAWAGRIYDLGCGIGGDALALARVGPVVAADRDGLRLAVLSANAHALDLQGSIALVQADFLRPPWRPDARALAFADPSRRRDGWRTRSSRGGDPPLAALVRLADDFDGMGVKLSPAVDREEIAGLGEIEFVSLEGELREATLWLGSLRTAVRRATLLPEGASLVGDQEPEIEAGAVEAYIYEPDPAVLRAALVHTLAGQIGARLIDPDLGLLTSSRPLETPFARRFRVVDVLPFGLKRLRRALQDRRVGVLTLKKRGSPVDTEAFRRRLRLDGPEEATVLLTKSEGSRVAVIVERE